jgi:predicted permease
MITLPSTAFNDVTARVSGIISDLWPFLAILLGVAIGFFVLEAIIGAVIRSRQDGPQ